MFERGMDLFGSAWANILLASDLTYIEANAMVKENPNRFMQPIFPEKEGKKK